MENNGCYYLVTGAAGFIGAELARRLLNMGHHVVTIDNLSTGTLEHIPEGVEFIRGDTHNPEVISELMKYRFEAIFHIAGQSGGVTCWEDPVYDLNANVTSTLLLLDYARRTDCKKFLYASSMSVYGDENPCPVREDDVIKPKTFYAVGKNASEHYMRIYSAEYGIECTALRLNNTYGPGQNMDNLLQGMVSIFLSQAISNHHIHVMGEKNRYRDFVYIDDTIDAFVKAESRAGKPELYTCYTVCTNRKTTCEQVVELIRQYLPFDVTVEYSGSTQGDQFGIYCSYERIYNALGWEPRVRFEDGLKRMVDWALERQ